MAKTTNTITAIFVIDRETKGAVRYNEVDSDGNPVNEVSGTIYLRKSCLGGTIPKGLKVSIETVG